MLAILSAGAVVVGVVDGLAGPFVSLLSPGLGRAMTSFILVGPVIAVLCGIAAIVTGNAARKRYPRETAGLVALIIGWCVTGGVATLAVFAVATWWWMMQHSR